MTHSHACLCGAVFTCRLDLLPTADGNRAWCKEWADALCNECLNSIYQAQGKETLQELAAVVDPSTSYRARLLCE
jgi:hypothetical protein